MKIEDNRPLTKEGWRYCGEVVFDGVAQMIHEVWPESCSCQCGKYGGHQRASIPRKQ